MKTSNSEGRRQPRPGPPSAVARAMPHLSLSHSPSRDDPFWDSYLILRFEGVATDLSHCNTPSQVLDFTGPSELANCLKGVDVVVIPAGVPRKPCMTPDD